MIINSCHVTSPVLSLVVAFDALLGRPLAHLLLEPLHVGHLGLDPFHKLLKDTRHTKEYGGLDFLQRGKKTTLHAQYNLIQCQGRGREGGGKYTLRASG